MFCLPVKRAGQNTKRTQKLPYGWIPGTTRPRPLRQHPHLAWSVAFLVQALASRRPCCAWPDSAASLPSVARNVLADLATVARAMWTRLPLGVCSARLT